MIGRKAPVVGTNIFDMVRDGETFHIFIPSKNQFLVGAPAHLELTLHAKPQENIRPQHLVDAIFWQPISRDVPVLFEEVNQQTAHFYVLTIAQPHSGAGTENATTASPDWEIARKIWFDRANLNVSEIQIYDPDGKMNSDIHFSAWNIGDPIPYPREISVHRITEDYQLQIEITKVAMNEPVEASRFVLAQPPGSTLVRVGEESETKSQEIKPVGPRPLVPKSPEPKSPEPKS